MNMNDADKTKGLYNKFTVTRTDGSSAPGVRHEGCQYFVLDLEHDKHAPAALRAYADSCRSEYPALAADLDRMFPNDPAVARQSPPAGGSEDKP
jgi:hypothetical protein